MHTPVSFSSHVHKGCRAFTHETPRNRQSRGHGRERCKKRSILSVNWSAIAPTKLPATDCRDKCAKQTVVTRIRRALAWPHCVGVYPDCTFSDGCYVLSKGTLNRQSSLGTSPPDWCPGGPRRYPVLVG